MNPEEAEAYKATIRKLQESVITPSTFQQGIGWILKLDKDYPEDGFKTLIEHLHQRATTRHLTPALKTYKTFMSLTPEGHETWNCAPTTYESIQRINEEARQCYQQLQRQGRDAHYHQQYQQTCLNFLTQTPSR